jgi:hypothetical protein
MMETSFPVEFSNGPSNSIASLPEAASQSGYDKPQFESACLGFSIRARRTLMQRTRGSHPRLLNDESVPQNVPGCNPQASLRAAWEHTNSIIRRIQELSKMGFTHAIFNLIQQRLLMVDDALR